MATSLTLITGSGGSRHPQRDHSGPGHLHRPASSVDEGTHQVTSPGRSTASRTGRWLRRCTSALTVTTAGAVLVLGSPVTTSATRAPEPGASTPDDGLTLVAGDPHRWPGHPGRRLVRYTVRPGDTATGLAVRFHAWTRELRSLNHLGRHGTLYVGRRIRIPVVVAAARKAHTHTAVKRHTTKPRTRTPHRRPAPRHPPVEARGRQPGQGAPRRRPGGAATRRRPAPRAGRRLAGVRLAAAADLLGRRDRGHAGAPRHGPLDDRSTSDAR